jgi:hypothetical protein
MFVLFENFVPNGGAMLLGCLVKVSICLNFSAFVAFIGA